MDTPKYSLLNAIIYEILRLLIEHWPGLKLNPGVAQILTHCFLDWVEWKTGKMMKGVDLQVEEITKEWQEQDNQKNVEKFQEVYPEAKVTVHDTNTGAVLIEHPPDGSKAQELLGGAMEIRSPWSEGKM
jgi:hypothetical protein